MWLKQCLCYLKSLGRVCDDPRRIDNHVLDPLPFPSVGHMDEAIFGLDHGWVAEFRIFRLFQYGDLLPLEAILRNGKVQQSPASPASFSRSEVVVDEQMTAIVQGHRIDT